MVGRLHTKLPPCHRTVHFERTMTSQSETCTQGISESCPQTLTEFQRRRPYRLVVSMRFIVTSQYNNSRAYPNDED